MPASKRLAVAAAVIGAGAMVLVPATAFAASRPAATTGSSVVAGSSTTGSGQASDPTCSASQFSTAQQKVETGLADRVTRLNKLLGDVQSTKQHLTSADQSTLEHDISSVELPGIEALQPQAQSATTCAELKTIAHSMVYDYRVYVVMSPQTHLTIAADDASFVDAKMAALEPKIEQAIADAKAKGKDVSGAEAAFADFQSQVSSAGSAVSGLSATLLAQTPQGYPGNESVFQGAKSTLSTARGELHQAYQDLETIRTDLRGASAASGTNGSGTAGGSTTTS
jgi:hypothetical protein